MMKQSNYFRAILLLMAFAFMGQAADSIITNVPRLAPLVGFTLKTGTNRPVSAATAKALGLGSRKLPATQIAVINKGEIKFHSFGVSGRNTNDLFVAHIDRNTRAGKVWLTSVTGEIRATILVSKDATPQVVTNGQYADEFEQELKLFLDIASGKIQEKAPPARHGPPTNNAVMLQQPEVTPLEKAVKSDDSESVKQLLDKGTDAKAKNSEGETALHVAADRGNVKIAGLLIAHGADVNAKGILGATPLHKAAWAGRDDVVKLLLAKGAMVDAKDETGVTPLISAADQEHQSTVEILLAKGADINAADQNGTTPLQCAVARGNLAITELLLAHGADVNLKNKRGNTALKFAIAGDQTSIAALLRQHGAKE